MTDESAKKPMPAFVITAIGLGVVICVVATLFNGGRSGARQTPTPDPFVVFMTVENDCGACGTNSPIGGWEARDGRSLILSDNGSFSATFKDGTSSTGTWTLAGNQLCLKHIAGETCYAYQQKLDAMKLDDAIYIRW